MREGLATVGVHVMFYIEVYVVALDLVPSVFCSKTPAKHVVSNT